jgi:hypothetical protein
MNSGGLRPYNPNSVSMGFTIVKTRDKNWCPFLLIYQKMHGPSKTTSNTPVGYSRVLQSLYVADEYGFISLPGWFKSYNCHLLHTVNDYI